jgi:hypothetical protein
VIDAQHRGLAIEEWTVDVGDEQADVLYDTVRAVRAARAIRSTNLDFILFPPKETTYLTC